MASLLHTLETLKSELGTSSSCRVRPAFLFTVTSPAYPHQPVLWLAEGTVHGAHGGPGLSCSVADGPALVLRPWAEIELPIGSVGDPSGVLTAALNS